MRFKYLRCLEALFESTPEAVLQLVFMMRTSEFKTIFILSITQSIISMANSMIKQDNAYMTHDKFKYHKKRFPIPYPQFIGHALFRCCEIASRIILLALFWVVVGGEAFVYLLLGECVCSVLYYIYRIYLGLAGREELFLALNIIIVMPPEWIFELNEYPDSIRDTIKAVFNGIAEKCGPCPCIFLPLIFIMSQFLLVILFISMIFYAMPPYFSDECYVFTNHRVFISLIEILVTIVYGLFYERENNYLLSKDHCRDIFIVCCVMFAIYSMFYVLLMPDIRLPDNINIRSFYGYSYLGNITELTRIMPFFVSKRADEAIEKLNKTRDELVTKSESEIRSIKQAINQFKNKLELERQRQKEKKEKKKKKEQEGKKEAPARAPYSKAQREADLNKIFERIATERGVCKKLKKEQFGYKDNPSKLKRTLLDKLNDELAPKINNGMGYAYKNDQNATIQWLSQYQKLEM